MKDAFVKRGYASVGVPKRSQLRGVVAFHVIAVDDRGEAQFSGPA
jgi:hypothetical protein